MNNENNNDIDIDNQQLNFYDNPIDEMYYYNGHGLYETEDMMSIDDINLSFFRSITKLSDDIVVMDWKNVKTEMSEISDFIKDYINKMIDYDDIGDDNDDDNNDEIDSDKTYYLMNGKSISIKNLIIVIWQKITKHPEKTKMLQEFSNDVQESIRYGSDLCPTGFVCQLLNCLSGYDNDVNIGYSLNLMAANLVHMYADKITKNEITYDDAYKALNDRLTENNMNKDMKEAWLFGFQESFYGINTL